MNFLFSVQCFGYDNFELIATANKHSTFDFGRTDSNLTIVDQDMDGVVLKWLHYLKLHKYYWFFEKLSYLEIEIIDEDNIEAFIDKVDKDAITKGAQKKICISTKMLRDRPQKLKDIIMVIFLTSSQIKMIKLHNINMITGLGFGSYAKRIMRVHKIHARHTTLSYTK